MAGTETRIETEQFSAITAFMSIRIEGVSNMDMPASSRSLCQGKRILPEGY